MQKVSLGSASSLMVIAVAMAGCERPTDVERFDVLPDEAIAAFREACTIDADGPAEPETGPANSFGPGIGRNPEDARQIVVQRCVVDRDHHPDSDRSADVLAYEAVSQRLVTLYMHLPPGEAFDHAASKILWPALTARQRERYAGLRAEVATRGLTQLEHPQWVTRSLAMSIELGLAQRSWLLVAMDTGTHVEPAHR